MAFYIEGLDVSFKDNISKVAFLDRDGVLNKDLGYVSSSSRFYLMENVISGMHLLQAMGFNILFYTNQSGIARGLYSSDEFEYFTNWVHAQLHQNEIRVLGTYYCPHHPEFTGPCSCRKPSTGMLRAAISKFKVDLTHSLAIGDKLTDLTPAAELGVNHLYLLDPQSNVQRDIGYKYTSAKSWVELVNIIKHINSDMGEY